MKPHPRIRKAIKWGGGVVTVVLVVVWVGSVRWSGGWRMANSVAGVSITSGQFMVIVSTEPDPEIVIYAKGTPDLGGWCFARIDRPMRWWYNWGWGRYGGLLAVPIWAIALLPLVLASIAWRLDTLARRRARLNLCPKCGYDRTGLAAGAVCPECGVGGAAATPS